MHPQCRFATLAAVFLLLATALLGLSALEAAQQPEKTQPPVKRQILAVGGGGLEKSGTKPVLMKYFIEMTGKPKPRVCFMPSASGDSKSDITRWNTVMKDFDCQPRLQKIYITSPGTKSFETEILEADAIYVGNGNALNMLAMWKAHGLDKLLRKAYDRGIVLGGEGAGSICWFEQGSTDSRPGKLSVMDCLGFLTGSNCTDYDGNKDCRPLYQDWIKSGQIKPGLAADNGVGLHFVDDKLLKVVSSTDKAKAYRVNREDGKIAETTLDTELLAK